MARNKRHPWRTSALTCPAVVVASTTDLLAFSGGFPVHQATSDVAPSALEDYGGVLDQGVEFWDDIFSVDLGFVRVHRIASAPFAGSLGNCGAVVTSPGGRFVAGALGSSLWE